jgi:alpha-glucoside transport system substrate-binding protein
MKSKVFKTFVVIVAASMVLVACAPAPTAAPTAMPATVAPTAMAEPTATEAMPVTGGIDCMGAQPGDTLTIVYEWTGAEEASFQSVLKPFVDACGIQITPTETRDPAVLDTMVKSTPPDVLMWPDLSPLKLYTDMLQPLDTVGGDMSNYASFWVTMGTVNSKWLAIPVKADDKSIIWYSPAQFQAYGYQVPTTLDELKTLVDQMVSDGNVPWSMGFNNGGSADGWTGTDFIQDLLLATQGPDYVNGIITGTVPYNDQPVMDAYTLYYQWASDPKYTVGGADGTVNTPFADAIYKVFSNPPEAMMVKQSGFAGGNIASQYPDLKFGTDYDFFQFPGVQGVQGGADFMMDFNPTPAA